MNRLLISITLDFVIFFGFLTPLNAGCDIDFSDSTNLLNESCSQAISNYTECLIVKEYGKVRNSSVEAFLRVYEDQWITAKPFHKSKILKCVKKLTNRKIVYMYNSLGFKFDPLKSSKVLGNSCSNALSIYSHHMIVENFGRIKGTGTAFVKVDKGMWTIINSLYRKNIVRCVSEITNRNTVYIYDEAGEKIAYF